MHVHIDGDILVYRAGFAAEQMYYLLTHEDAQFDEVIQVQFPYKKEALAYVEEKNLKEGEYSLEKKSDAEPVENALYNLRSMITKCMEDLAVSQNEITVYLTGPTNFRDGIATVKPYKGNRDAAHKPVHAQAIKDHICELYPSNISEDEEADDVISYSHYAMYLNGEDTVICSLDKDLDMVPGMHYNFVKEESYMVDDEQAMYYFYRQLLTGDAVDNIPGLHRVGNKTADKMLADCHMDERAMLDLVRTKYKEEYGDKAEDMLLEVGRLLWMRRKPNELWTPPA